MATAINHQQHADVVFENGYAVTLSNFYMSVDHSSNGGPEINARGVVVETSCDGPGCPSQVVGSRCSVFVHGQNGDITEVPMIVTQMQTSFDYDWTPFVQGQDDCPVGIELHLVNCTAPKENKVMGYNRPPPAGLSKPTLIATLEALSKAYTDGKPIPPEMPKPASMMPNAPPPEPTYDRPKRRVRLVSK